MAAGSVRCRSVAHGSSTGSLGSTAVGETGCQSVSSRMTGPTMEHPDKIPLSTQFAVVHAMSGRLRLRLVRPRTLEGLEAGQAALQALPGVKHVRCNRSAWSLVVEYDTTQTSPQALLKVPVARRRSRHRSGAWSHDVVEAQTVIAAPVARVWEVVSSMQRLAALFPLPVQLSPGVDTDHWMADLQAQGQRVSTLLTVIKRVPGERLIVASEGGGVGGWLSISLRSDDDGTWLEERLHYDSGAGNLLGWIVGRLWAQPFLQEQVQRHVAHIRAEAEA
jgi:hypothetical protein